MIVASFQSQYGLRLSKEIHTMTWDEFRDLLVGISPETPLGRIVSIRAEDDKEVLNLLKDRKVIVLINKNDIGTVLTAEGIADELSGLGIDINIRDIISISAETGDGLELLESSIRDIVFAGNVRADEEVFVSNEGQARLLGQSLEYLGNAMKSIDAGMSEDFIVIDLRSAWEALGRITGETVEEDIIDRIFSEFCIGK